MEVKFSFKVTFFFQTNTKLKIFKTDRKMTCTQNVRFPPIKGLIKNIIILKSHLCNSSRVRDIEIQKVLKTSMYERTKYVIFK